MLHDTHTEMIPAGGRGPVLYVVRAARRVSLTFARALRALDLRSGRNGEKAATMIGGYAQRKKADENPNRISSHIVEDPQEFARFVDDALRKLHVPDEVLCERFDVPVAVVRGWCDGKAVAHRVVREDVVEYLDSLLAQGNRAPALAQQRR